MSYIFPIIFKTRKNIKSKKMYNIDPFIALFLSLENKFPELKLKNN